MKFSSRGLVSAFVYLVIAVGAIIYTWHSFTNYPSREFNGIWAILFTLPLSLLRIVFKNSPPNALIMQSVIYALINSSAVYLAVSKSEKNT